MNADFVEPLLIWFENNARDLPWRHTKDPYAIWVSEIMLQQTRVEAVKGYFTRFMSAFPTIKSLSESDEDYLLKLWEGLGYYSRVRNLKKAAQIIQEKYSRSFPSSYEELLTLPGIGPYTAGAISSIAFSVPVPAIDGNVLRVLSRLNCDDRNMQNVHVRKELRDSLMNVIPKDAPGTFNQALMELGATVCLPSGTPLCSECPLKGLCKAHLAKTELEYPVRPIKKDRSVQEKTVFVLYQNGKPFGFKRPSTGLLASMYQFPEQPGFFSDSDIAHYIGEVGLSPEGEIRISFEKHIFTHLEWHMKVCTADVSVLNPSKIPNDWILLNFDLQSLPTAYRICTK